MITLFDKHTNGFVYVTGDLIGEKQKKSDAGNYELMICHREKDTAWRINLICEFVFYTLQASINSYETMSLEGGQYSSDKYSIKHLLFHKYADFLVDKKRMGLMLLIGITQQEADWGSQNGNEELVKMLKEKKVYPVTDLYRKSIV